MTMTRIVFFAGLAGLFLLHVPVARATVLVPADFEELVLEARAILHGQVTDVRAEWADGRRRIHTFVTVAVTEYLKGDLGRTASFVVPGGELGGYRSVLVGAPVLAPGDEVVLFLGSRGPGIPFVLGLSQGVMRVRTDPRSGQKTVTTPLRTGGLEAGAGVVARGAVSAVALPTLRQRVRETLAQAPPIRRIPRGRP
ncbi:MAG: hypothetical protein HYX76_07315 [Acidobacteria bacterium]|nr:hypothetical protein [Acidobacteriota bacterium]